MRKVLTLLTALTGIGAVAPIVAHAAPLDHPAVIDRAPARMVRPIDYYWNHEHWRHRDWDHDHHRWHYYN